MISPKQLTNKDGILLGVECRLEMVLNVRYVVLSSGSYTGCEDNPKKSFKLTSFIK